MQAITTKRTEHGIVARCAAKSIRVARDYSVNEEQRHLDAAKQLAAKLGWLDGYGTWVGGCDHAGNYVWVCVIPKQTLTFNELQS